MSIRRGVRVCALAFLPFIFGCRGEEGNSTSAARPAAEAPAARAAEPADSPVVLFLGTSLTAGLGLDPEDAYPALLQAKVDSAGLPYRVVNAGSSGETSAGAVRRLEWLLRQPFDVLVGMQALPNLGRAYGERFGAIYPALAEEYDVPLVPFLLQGVGGDPALNLPDGVHPNERGHRVVAATVWRTLEPVLRARAPARGHPS